MLRIAELFRRHVKGRAHCDASVRQAYIAFHLLRKTQIGNLHSPIVTNEYVSGLDVTVYQTCSMRSCDATRGAMKDACRLLGIKGTLACYPFPKIFAFEELHHDVM